MAVSTAPCFTCEPPSYFKCRRNQTQCECINGFNRSNCSVSISTSSRTTEIIKSDALFYGYNDPDYNDPDISTLNIGSIAACILGGILLALIVCLIIFVCWRRRKNQKKKLLELSSSSKQDIIPPLYDIAISRHNSLVPSGLTTGDHIYEDLP